MQFRLAVFAFTAAAAGGAQAQFYSCVDAKGNRLTSDRPIMECLDREQQRYDGSGSKRGTLGPSLTPLERAAQEEKARREAEQRARQAELRQRDRVLVGRYPDEAAHKRERQASLARIDEAIKTGEAKKAALEKQRKALEADIKASADDVVKTGRLRRAMTQNDEHQAALERLFNAQEEERQRIVKRFDEELARLKVLWAEQAVRAQAAPVKAKP
jgi:hypothetical protein